MELAFAALQVVCLLQPKGLTDTLLSFSHLLAIQFSFPPLIMSYGVSDEVAEDFKLALEDLTMNSRYEISNLTVIAKENTEHALAISEALQDHIKKVSLFHMLGSQHLSYQCEGASRGSMGTNTGIDCASKEASSSVPA